MDTEQWNEIEQITALISEIDAHRPSDSHTRRLRIDACDLLARAKAKWHTHCALYGTRNTDTA